MAASHRAKEGETRGPDHTHTHICKQQMFSTIKSRSRLSLSFLVVKVEELFLPFSYSDALVCPSLIEVYLGYTFKFSPCDVVTAEFVFILNIF